MIAHLRGHVAHSSADSMVVDVGGVGYLVSVPTPLAERAEPDQAITLATHMVVREGEMALFGFGSPQEREIFRLLISLNGIGPKLALRILSALSPAALASAILDEDVPTLTRVPGVGQRTAKRLMLELSEKIGALAPALGEARPDGQEEAESVLISLGCSRQEARQVVRQAREAQGDSVGVEHLVMEALRLLGER